VTLHLIFIDADRIKAFARLGTQDNQIAPLAVGRKLDWGGCQIHRVASARLVATANEAVGPRSVGRFRLAVLVRLHSA